jgi:ADP-ribose pyrophosphatase YjhB (NUDIX family)
LPTRRCSIKQVPARRITKPLDSIISRQARQRFLLRIWKTVPFPRFVRRTFIELTHPRFLVGVVAYIRNANDEVLLFHHTYRRRNSWSLPGGYVEWRESPREGITREVHEESGLVIRAGRTLAASFHSPEQLDLLIECEIISGTPTPSPEVDNWRYVPSTELAAILPNHRTLLREAGLI